MNRTLLAVFLASLTVCMAVVVIQAGGFSRAAAKTIHVPKDYISIQEAIDNAAPGETIQVNSGTYREHVIVDKPVLLIGEDKTTTIIDGSGTGTVVQIDSDNVLVANFTVRNAASDQWFGHGFPDGCIRVQDVENVAILNNVMSQATVAVWSFYSTNVNCSGNSVSDTSTMGTVDYNCVNSSISGNHLDDCGLIGVHLDGGSQNCKITGNTIENCLDGIDVEKSSGNLIQRNVLLSDNMSMCFTEDTGNTVEYCTLQNSSVGVGFIGASGNTFTHNSFIGNARQVASNFNTDSLARNQWDSDGVGNYWSDYSAKYPNATEVGSTGTADTAYVIDAGNADHHPLISPAPTPTATPSVPEFPFMATLLLVAPLVSACLLTQRKRRNTPLEP